MQATSSLNLRTITGFLNLETGSREPVQTG